VRAEEFLDIGGTGRGSVEAFLDAIASTLDLRAFKVEFVGHAGYAVAFDVLFAAMVAVLEVCVDVRLACTCQ
jgi:hypothetical protein